MVVSDNNFFSVNAEIYCTVGWQNLLGFIFSSLFTQCKVEKGYIFIIELQSDKSNNDISCISGLNYFKHGSSWKLVNHNEKNWKQIRIVYFHLKQLLKFNFVVFSEWCLIFDKLSPNHSLMKKYVSYSIVIILFFILP